MKRNSIYFLCLTSVIASPVCAYEIATHALVTLQAKKQSVLNREHVNSVIPYLLFDRIDLESPFRESYLDNAASADNPDAFARDAWVVESREFNKLIAAGYLQGESLADVRLSIEGWLMRGSIREDDNEVNIGAEANLPFEYWRALDEFDPDPWGHLFRAPRHFYDPIYNRAFVYRDACAVYGCVASVSWALGSVAPFEPAIDEEDTARRNHFSWNDATRNYWLGLTVNRDYDGNGFGSNQDRFLSAQERKDRWATTIKSLGHVIHLAQDAAQPQHTRNDAHAPPHAALGPDNDANGAFEAYTNFRVVRSADQFSDLTRNPLREMAEGIPDLGNLPKPHLGSYPTVSFATPVRYFSTRHINSGNDVASINLRRGIIDFSNRNFFTSGSLPGFSECPQPGTVCEPGLSPTYVLPENDLDNPAIYTEVQVPSTVRIDGRQVWLNEFARRAGDALNPSYQEKLDPAYQGKVPVVSRAIFADDPDAPATIRSIMRYNNFVADADVLLPRAVAYSAGLIDHFFRGRLEVLPPNDRVVGVLNQGALHTMNLFGYPCTGDATNDGCAMFGFQKIRLRVRNATAAIVESGTGQSVPQRTGGSGAQLVAVARYHRNTCYKPDLSGERVQRYAPPPAVAITEPVCSSGQTVRTDPVEISVSEPLMVAAGELDDLAAGTGVEKLFDFSADPIPVNATDLFIQVAYRGPMGDAALGLDRDVIAVGVLDVREPTFVSFWNNTDYFWSGAEWLGHNGTYPNRGVKDFWVCAGGFPVKLVYHYQGAAGVPALIDPVSGANVPGHVRLGFLFPPPDAGFPNQRNSIRGTPVVFSNPRLPVRTAVSGGQFRQASKESVGAATLANPTLNCGSQLPIAQEYWCFDPIQQRRGRRLGASAQPLYLEQASGSGATDVDAALLPAFADTQLTAGGTLRFNTDTTLASCPAQPAEVPAAQDHGELRHIEQREEAAHLGIATD